MKIQYKEYQNIYTVEIQYEEHKENKPTQRKVKLKKGKQIKYFLAKKRKVFFCPTVCTHRRMHEYVHVCVCMLMHVCVVSLLTFGKSRM